MRGHYDFITVISRVFIKTIWESRVKGFVCSNTAELSNEDERLKYYPVAKYFFLSFTARIQPPRNWFLDLNQRDLLRGAFLLFASRAVVAVYIAYAH